MTPDISVIIPLYNTEKYIRACVDSVLNQTFENFEVIIVDDCSTDNGFELCKKLYGSNERIVLLQNQKNSGVGITRNNGIKNAHGKYIAFADSDDQMISDNLSKMFETAEKYNADVVHGSGFLICNGDNTIEDMLKLPKNSFMSVSLDNKPVKEISVLNLNSGNRDLILQRWSEHYYHTAIWNKLVKREMLINKNIEFLSVPRSEDDLFSFVCLFNSERYVLMPLHSYIYRRLDESGSRSKNPADVLFKALFSSIKVLRQVQIDMKKIPFFAENQENFNKVLNCMITNFNKFSLIPSYKQVDWKDELNAEKIKNLFEELFNLDSPFVSHLFHTAYKSYDEMPNIWENADASKNFWEQMKDE